MHKKGDKDHAQKRHSKTDPPALSTDAMHHIAVLADTAGRQTEWVFLDTVLDQMPVGVLMIDAATEKVILRNKKFNEITAMPSITYFREYEQYYTAHYKDGRKYNPEDCPIIRSIIYDETITDEEMVFHHQSGGRLSLSVNSAPVLDSSGRLIAGVALYGDITARTLVETNVEFLSEASKILNSSLDQGAIMQNIAELVKDYIADGCSIDLMNEKGELQLVGMAYRDPEKQKYARAIREKGYVDINSQIGAGMVIRTGRSALYHKIRPAVVKQLVSDKEYADVLAKSGLVSAVIVPLESHGVTVGAISLVSADEKRLFDKIHLNLAEELAYRVSLTLENVRLYQGATAAIALRDDLINMASHELRTPVGSIALSMYALRKQLEKKLDASTLSQIGEIDNQVAELEKLINTLLDSARVQGGKLEYANENFDLNSLIQEVAARAQKTTEKHHIMVQGAATQPVDGDPVRIGHVVTNLLSNAIKYSKAGDIIVTVESETTHVTVRVQDFGIGIAKEHQEKIFDRFYQIPDLKIKTYPGLGIGLYISSEIVKNHGGKLWVESEPGKSSTFIFTIPIASTGHAP